MTDKLMPLGQDQIKRLDNELNNYLTAKKTDSPIGVGMLVADAMINIKNLMRSPEVRRRIIALKNTHLGFLTDESTRKSGNYKEEEIIDAVTEGLLKGAHLANNEINVISGRSYLTKNFYSRALRQLNGLTDLSIVIPPATLSTKGNGAIVKPRMTYKWQGEKKNDQIELAIKVDSWTGHDAVIGKAERKAKKWLYDKLTGSITSDGEVGEDTPIEVKTSSLEKQLAAPPLPPPTETRAAKPLITYEGTDDPEASEKNSATREIIPDPNELSRQLMEIFGGIGISKVKIYLRHQSIIGKNQTNITNLLPDQAKAIIDHPEKFAAAVKQHWDKITEKDDR